MKFAAATSRALSLHHPTDRIAHTTAFGTPAVGQWLEGEIAQYVHHEGSGTGKGNTTRTFQF